MPETVRGLQGGRLERSCGLPAEHIRSLGSAPGLERVDVSLTTSRFEPHRHDTYALGITTSGVQRFSYRGASRICLPGQLHVLHPDELHDGAPATEAGFSYRILYLAPELVRGALAGRGLPFVADPVHEQLPAARPLVDALLGACDDEPLTELASTELTVAAADCLAALSNRSREPSRTAVDLRGLERVRAHLAAHPGEATPASFLEELTGLDRFAIARQFRRAFGTSPDRYRTLRRLELARAAIRRGESLAEAAFGAGFADQSHLTRQFRRAYGLTPARWAMLVRP